MAENLRILHPDYFLDFNCIGGACEDNCCKGWTITVDKNMYQRYRRIEDPAFAEKARRCIKRVRGDKATDENYAQFVMNGPCNFMAEDGRCEIQRDYGAEYLCHTCTLYPRESNRVVSDMLEVGLSMSCPEVVRKLFREKQIIFQITELERISGFEHTDVYSLLQRTQKRARKDRNNGNLATFAWDIRECCIDVLQSRRIPLSHRILAIGVLISRTVELIGDREPARAEILGITNDFRSKAGSGFFDHPFETLEGHEEAVAVMRVNMSSYLIRLIIASAQSDTAYGVDKAIADFDAAVKSWAGDGRENGSFTIKEIVDYVDEQAAKHWDSFLAEREYVLENYFVSYVFSQLFPFTYQADCDIYQHVIILAVQYALLRMMLCVIAGDGAITDTMLNEVIRSVAKKFAHSPTVVKALIQEYAKHGANSVGHLAVLLK
jgi:lysine-N-methylase